MFLWEDDTPIIIWGTGNLGKILYHKYKNKYDIKLFIDNNKHNENDVLYGKRVLQYSLELNKNYKILIASSFWEEISMQLVNSGLEIYENFCPYWMFEYEDIDYFSLIQMVDECEIEKLINIMRKNKEIVIIHGNCQTIYIQMYLNMNIEFKNKYIFLNIPRVCNYSREWIDTIKDEAFWRRCSLVITQNISKSNRFDVNLATDFIRSKLNNECQVVTIPNIYFDGYFPQIINNNNNVLIDIHQSGLFPNGDKYVNDLFFQGYDEKEIIDKISDENFILEEDLDKVIENSFNNLEIKEANCDIKILDYIKKHYKEQQLFYSPNHPINLLIKICTIRILKYLKINDIYFEKEDIYEIDINKSLIGQDSVIYPAVIKILNLKKYQKIYYPNKYLIDYYVSFKEYIQDYINVCLKIKNKL